MVEIYAYAADCLLYGHVESGEGRLSDQLNSRQELHLRDAQIEDLADGHVVAIQELTVARDELCAVIASGPRGDGARRLNTRTARVELEVGPYRVVGRVHGPPTADPFASILRRAAWVPLTEATVTYRRSGKDMSDTVATLLVNRHQMHSFRVAEANSDLPL